jgi:hypothetical protein
MWQITRNAGTLQQVLIMAAMNLLHTKLGKKGCQPKMANSNRDNRLHGTEYVNCRRKTMQAP